MTTKELGEKIRERRTILRLQQRDLAELSGVALRTIIQIEKGAGNPSLTTMNKVSSVLGMQIQLSVLIK